MHRVRLALNNAVPDEISVPHLEGVTGHSHNPLHEILRTIQWPLEDNDVPPLRRPDFRKLHAREWNLSPIHHFVDEQEVPDEESSLHAAGRDLESFDEERTNDKEQRKRDCNRAEPLPEIAEHTATPDIDTVECSFSSPLGELHPFFRPRSSREFQDNCRSAPAAKFRRSQRTRLWSRNRTRRPASPLPDDRCLSALHHRTGGVPRHQWSAHSRK